MHAVRQTIEDQQMTLSTPRRALRLSLATVSAIALLSACGQQFDYDLRDGLSAPTTPQVVTADRPNPDDRGVISYPNYQVVAAQRDDTVRAIAGRLGLNADTLARYNGIDPDVPLRRDEVIALPSRVAEPSPATGAIGTGPILPGPIDVTTLASNAIDRAGTQQTVTTTPLGSGANASAVPQFGSEPIQHRVGRGETVYTIARLYNVPVRNIAEWNALGPDLAVREGQFLLIPTPGASRPASAVQTATEPGVGSPTPVPPSASEPLPAQNVTTATPPAAAPPAPDLGATQTPRPASASGKPLAYPVQGSIIRAYAKGRNEGIDIGVAAGTEVKAAAAGTVAAVTTDTNGVAIVVIRHDGNLLTVYTNLEGLTVQKDVSVRQGQTIGRVKSGSPSFLHFEVRQGLESVDPAQFLP
jgi:murein DD-endopeptidase MepM/ murein hydrolase activator NlpD